MLLFYRIIVFLVLILSPIILFGRIIKKKETLKSFFEKIGIYNKHKTRSKRKLIWIHGSSVGEILGVLPLIEKLDQSKYIGQILITSNTLSSSKIINNLNLKKTVHQFFPLDTNFLSKRGDTLIRIKISDENNNFNFQLKNKRNIDRKAINLLRNKEISAIIS